MVAAVEAGSAFFAGVDDLVVSEVVEPESPLESEDPEGAAPFFVAERESVR